MAENDKKDIRTNSHVYDSMVKSPNRAMMRATGMEDADFKKPLIGVISTWAENTPYNMHLHDFGIIAKKGIQKAGGWPVQFGTVTVSDGIAMGTPGMSYSLPSRDIIYTANTMASAIEAMGMSLPGPSSNPAISEDKRKDVEAAGAMAYYLLENNIRPKDNMTRKAFENAITVVMALGGSTNAILHLLAMAHAADVDLTIDDFNEFQGKVPHLADLKPSGQYVFQNLFEVGGVQVVMKYLYKTVTFMVNA